MKKLVIRNVAKANGETEIEVQTDYKLPEPSPIEKRVVDTLNTLCRKYQYAELKDHTVISDSEIQLSVDYKFNGKHLGIVTFILEKMANDVWTSRSYLSLKVAGHRVPLTNLATFVCDFKRLVSRLHRVTPQVETL